MTNSVELQKEARAELAKRLLAQRSFLRFITYINPWFRISWHHEIVADALERIESGQLKRLMIFMPPRHSKSEMVSVHFAPWLLGRDKNKSVIEASYSADLASEFGRQARNIVDGREYKNIFDTTLAEDSQSKSTWSTNGRGKYNAVGIGGAVTGKGADVLIIDDPIKNRKDADSFLVRENVHNWYKSTARTRLSPSGAIIIVVTRWHDDDLAGRILAGENASDWEVISLPAIAIDDEPHRGVGEALWPTQYDRENLLNTKAEVGLYEWSSLYQQQPISSETQEFTPAMFRTIAREEVDKLKTTRWVTIDPAVKEKDSADKTGISMVDVDTDNNWYVESRGLRINSAKLVDEIFTIWTEDKPSAIGIEETTYYDAVYPFLKLEMVRRNVFPIIYALKHGATNKNTRIRGLIPRYENGKIFHILDRCDTLEEEELRFPKGRHDDEVDALAYQTQIVQAPEPDKTYYEQVREQMNTGTDDRTGYLSS